MEMNIHGAMVDRAIHEGAAMRVAAIAVIGSVIVLCGCAGNRGFGQGSSGTSSPVGSGGGSPWQDSGPSLGTPSLGFPSQDNSSSYKPESGGGPVLGFPELPTAFQDEVTRRAPRTAQFRAPAPRSSTNRKAVDPAANPVSTADRSGDAPNWNRFYRSSDRRPIESLTLGSGSARVAILGSLHGDETQSTALVEGLARYLRQHPDQLAGTTVLLVKSPNPDGSSGRSPYNVHGVDLNRNFPSANWKLLAHNRAGAKPKSEAETQVAVRLLTDFHPHLVVHLKDSRRGGVVNFEGNIQPLADKIGGLISGQVVQGLGEKTSGSVENFALTRLSCPSLTMLVTLEQTDQAAWARNRDALLMLCQPGSIDRGRSETRGDGLINSIDDQPDPFEQPPVHNSSMRQQRPGDRSGMVTTRSKSIKPSQLPEFPLPVPEQGYLELPSP
jgi:hypothetical protein